MEIPATPDGPSEPTRRRGRPKGLRNSKGSRASETVDAYVEKLPRIRLRDAWGESPRHIARVEGVPLRDVKELLLYPEAEWAALKDKIRLGMAQQIQEKMWMLLEHLTPEKANAASALQLTTSLGILVDKSRLLDGLPTSIVGEIEVDVAKLMQPDILKRLIQLKGGVQNLRPEHQALAEQLGVTVDVTPSR